MKETTLRHVVKERLYQRMNYKESWFLFWNLVQTISFIHDLIFISQHHISPGVFFALYGLNQNSSKFNCINENNTVQIFFKKKQVENELAMEYIFWGISVCLLQNLPGNNGKSYQQKLIYGNTKKSKLCPFRNNF